MVASIRQSAGRAVTQHRWSNLRDADKRGWIHVHRQSDRFDESERNRELEYHDHGPGDCRFDKQSAERDCGCELLLFGERQRRHTALHMVAGFGQPAGRAFHEHWGSNLRHTNFRGNSHIYRPSH